MNRKEYGFRLHDIDTGTVAQDWRWYPYEDSRDAFARQYAHDGDYNIEKAEREKPVELPQSASPRPTAFQRRG